MVQLMRFITLVTASFAWSGVSAGFLRHLTAMQHGPIRPYCQIEDGFDFVGKDIKNVQGTVEKCCWECAKTEGCKAWSWNEFNGGTCWLKSGRDDVVVNPKVKSALYFNGYAPVCRLEKDIDFEGNDIGNAPGEDAYACCSKCQKTPKCRAVSWSKHNGGTCWFKSKRGDAVRKPGVDSTEAYPSFYQEPPTCVLERDVDFVGHDIGAAPAKVAGECCTICDKTPKCRAYTWTNHNGGTCWLKQYRVQANAKSGAISGVRFPNPSIGCDESPGMDILGEDIGNTQGCDAQLCCAMCYEREDCKAYTWSTHNDGTCWFKSSNSTMIRNPRALSGIPRK